MRSDPGKGASCIAVAVVMARAPYDRGRTYDRAQANPDEAAVSERRPFPPSPRRLALARQAGLTATSPLVVGAVAGAAAVIAAIALGRAASTRLATWIAAACRGQRQFELG